MFKKIIIIFSILMLIFTFFVSPVQSASGIVTLADWDDVASGLSHGTSGLIEFDEVTGASFQTINTNYVSSPNSFKVGFAGAATLGYWNLTGNFSYIGQINLSAYYEMLGGFSDLYIEFINNGTTVIKLNIDHDEKIYYYKVGVGYTLIYDGAVNTRYYIVVTHITTNQFNYSVYNASFDLVGSDEGSGNSAGDYTTFDSVYFNSNTETGTLYFDNLIISTTVVGEGGYADLSGYNSICSGGEGSYSAPYWQIIHKNIFGWTTSIDTFFPQYLEHEFPFYWTGTINAVDIPISNEQYNYVSGNVADYYMYINGVPFGNPIAIIPSGSGEYLLRWYSTAGITLINEKPLFSVKCDQTYTVGGETYYWYGIGITYSPIGDTKGHNTLSYFMDTFHNGNNLNAEISMCYYFTGTSELTSDPYNDTEWDDWATEYGNPTYGNMGIQFKTPAYDCQFRAGNNPIIRYNLSGDYLEDDSPYYRYRIYMAGSSYLYYQGLISVFEDYKRGEETIQDFEFPIDGYYYIVLYNTTEYGTTINRTLLTSDIIHVCESETEGGSNAGLENFDFSDIPILFKILISLFIIIILTISPYFFAAMINRGRTSVNMPDLVYVAFFFIGIAVCVMLGFLEIYVFFLVLVGLIVTFTILWLQGKSLGGEE